MKYQIRVGHPEGTKLVIIKATCDKDAYFLMQDAVSKVMRYKKNMKVTVNRDFATPQSIDKTIEFLSEKSAKKFYERIPKLMD